WRRAARNSAPCCMPGYGPAPCSRASASPTTASTAPSRSGPRPDAHCARPARRRAMTEPDTLLLPPGALMPNSRLPVLIYRKVLEGGARGFDSLFRANGCGGTWRDGIYDYDHFHSNAHVVRGVDAGSARAQLGGEEGQAVEIEAGDVVVLPAGTGHRRIGKSGDFSVSG